MWYPKMCLEMAEAMDGETAEEPVVGLVGAEASAGPVPGRRDPFGAGGYG